MKIVVFILAFFAITATAQTRFNGPIGLGTDSVTNVGIIVQGTVTSGGVSQTGIEIDATATLHATQDYSALAGRVRIPDGLTTGATYGLYISDMMKYGSGRSLRNYGIYVQPMVNGDDNYAIYTEAGKVKFGDSVSVSSATGINISNGWNVPMSGSGSGISCNGTGCDIAAYNGPITLRSGNDGAAQIVRATIDDKGVTVNSGTLTIPVSTPSGACTPGSFSGDNNYIYFCASTGWKRAALSAF